MSTALRQLRETKPTKPTKAMTEASAKGVRASVLDKSTWNCADFSGIR